MEKHHNGNAVKHAFYAVPNLDLLLWCVEGMQCGFVGQEQNLNGMLIAMVIRKNLKGVTAIMNWTMKKWMLF
jgi:hypothetical protein